jgi:thioredoxin-dependent peroxiredoxin
MKAAMLKVGDTAPAFEGVDQHGNALSLDELTREKVVVLYFYPKDFTPVCTREACLFRDAYAELADKNVAVVGVSFDDGDSHKRFSEKYTLPFSLLPDKDKRLGRSYGVVGLFGGAKRVTYVIDRQKKIRGVFHHELMAGKHLDDVRQLIGSL